MDNWSKIKTESAEEIILQVSMTESEQQLIDLAKQTGTWHALTEGPNLNMPKDLKKIFAGNRKAFKNYNNFSLTSRRVILEWIRNAKCPETRSERVEVTIRLAGN